MEYSSHIWYVNSANMIEFSSVCVDVGMMTYFPLGNTFHREYKSVSRYTVTISMASFLTSHISYFTIPDLHSKGRYTRENNPHLFGLLLVIKKSYSEDSAPDQSGYFPNLHIFEDFKSG